jgi:hypothetical protein
MFAKRVHFSSDGKKLIRFEWTPIRYRNVISMLKNTFYEAPSCKREESPCQQGAVHTWHLSSVTMHRWGSNHG